MISVIIPLYNAESTIVKALDSVKNQKTDEVFEIFVINDGSTDNSKEIVENYILENPEMKIHLIHQENKGVSAARNAGLRLAKGEFIALLDADDVWLPEKTEKQMQFLKSEKKIDFIASARNYNNLLFPYQAEKGKLSEITFKKLLIRNETQPSTVIFKNKILQNTGFFDDKQRYAEDVNYWMKISEKNKMFILNETLVLAGGKKKSFGVSGLSANLKEMHKGYLKNLQDMHNDRRIGTIEFAFYRTFFKLKYLFLIWRCLLNNKYKKNEI